jgi:exodeoxyribonuclease VII large subunit
MDSDSDIVKLSDLIANVSHYVNSNRDFKSINAEVEITELKEYPSLVFMRVCEPKQDVIKAVIYKSKYHHKLNSGNKIRINCELKFYKNEIELVVNSYELAGAGAHSRALTKLKVELAELGYFDNKKRIKQNYHTIGVISSINAAGFKDFVHTLNARCSGKKVYLYPAKVQGITAPQELSSAIKTANDHDQVQILAIIRGGGGKDDLECFNDKLLAKTIFKSNLPIVTGIGHQIDTSIADLVADQNFITPTAVAQNITEENLLTVQKIQEKISNLQNIFQTKINLWYNYISSATSKLHKYKNIHTNQWQNILGVHQLQRRGLEQKIRTTNNLKFDYLVRNEKILHDLKEKLTHHYFHLLNSHLNYLELYNVNLKEKIFSMNDQLNILSRPKIIRTTNNEEIHTLKEFKTHHNYQICFIDGSYDIKIHSK